MKEKGKERTSEQRNTYLGDSGNHVADEGLEGGDRAALLGTAEPHLDVEVEPLSGSGGLLLDLHLHGHVGEVLGDLALGALDLHSSCLHCHSHYTVTKQRLPPSGM